VHLTAGLCAAALVSSQYQREVDVVVLSTVQLSVSDVAERQAGVPITGAAGLGPAGGLEHFLQVVLPQELLMVPQLLLLQTGCWQVVPQVTLVFVHPPVLVPQAGLKRQV
jgi:hypothetical protein